VNEENAQKRRGETAQTTKKGRKSALDADKIYGGFRGNAKA